MAGIALKGQCDFVSIMVPPDKKSACEEKQRIVVSKFETNAVSSRALMEALLQLLGF